MKKFILQTLCAALFGAAAHAVPNAEDAAKAADAIYSKQDSFSDTILKSRPAYAKWVEENTKYLGSEVKFGPWYVSQYIDKFRKNASAAIDPRVHPVDLKAIYGRAPMWEQLDIPDASVFDLHARNFRLLNNCDVFLTREISAADDLKTFITVGGSENPVAVFLDGSEIKSVEPLKNSAGIYELDLKKGKNTLVFKYNAGSRLDRDVFYFAPYADPVCILSQKLNRDFDFEMRLIKNQRIQPAADNLLAFDLFAGRDNSISAKPALDSAVEFSLFSAGDIEKERNAIGDDKSPAAFDKRVKLLDKAIQTLRVERELGYDIKNVRAAMEDIKKTYPEYDADGKFFAALKDWEKKMPTLKAELYKAVVSGKDSKPFAEAAEFKKFASSALLANPILKNFPKWVYIKRDAKTARWGLPQNWQGNTAVIAKGSNINKDDKAIASYKDEIRTFEIAKPEASELLYKPEQNNLIADLDVSYDGKKVLYSTLDKNKDFQMDELDAASGKTKEISPRMYKGVDNYDGVYLPDGKILYCSTACYVGVPCVSGTDYVANIYTLDPKAGNPEAVDKTVRQLTFEQDADWMPVVMENGRILYTRWEYVDNSHYFSRILMHMNPDGTAQSSFYGSTSYWPTSLFYARPIPGDPNKFVGIVSGHHGIARSGELHLFDVSKGTFEETGRVHKFPSFGRKYVAETKDELVRGKWPQVLHPYPLSENCIVAAVRAPAAKQDNFGIYLIDKFDNMTPLVSDAGSLAIEPMPLQARKKPSEIADKTDRDLDYGYVFLNDIYQGNGLKGVPRGKVKALRVIEYFYAYRDMGAHNIIANEGSWDVKRIHGTVPVEADGSALFKVPANRPIAIQPLDENGKALALMRTWFTVMPGEVQSCVGCHEGQGMTPTSKPALAARKKPTEIKKFIGDVRGFSFHRDVQPILDKYCAGCHDGKKKNIPSFVREPFVEKKFPEAYLNLSKYVRRSGPECNQNMLIPMEFNSDTSELMQLLKKGHKGVKLDEQSKAILTTWIDLNIPCFGTWKEISKVIPHDGDKMREFFLAKYANRHDDQNAINYDGGVQTFVKPTPSVKHPAQNLKTDGFPFDAAKAAQMQSSSKLPREIEADLGGGVKLRLVLVPSGSFVMGSDKGFFDEGPAKLEKVEKPFYMGQFEITNRQYSLFDSAHDSGYQDRQWKDHINRGYPANLPEQPVVRISWKEAEAYCAWLSQKLGITVSLPTEKQWEWAARAGTASDFWFGKVGDNYGDSENLSDYTVRNMAVNGVDPQPRVEDSLINDIQTRDDFAYDAQLTACNVGAFKPNAFGLYDMIGNVSEWTADDYAETLNGKPVAEKKTVRGGSWRDRAKRSRVTMRRDYFEWQKVYNVGVRVVIDDAAKAAELLKPAPALPAPAKRDITPPVDNIPTN